MPRPKPVSMLCTYRPRAGQEEAFLAILRDHWKTLRAAGLAAAERAEIWRASDRKGRTVFVERFSWASAAAADEAHGRTEVMALWDLMERLCEEMDFLELSRITPRRAARRRPAPHPPRGAPAGRRRA
jgi:quinol monooxygenase YgiN